MNRALRRRMNTTYALYPQFTALMLYPAAARRFRLLAIPNLDGEHQSKRRSSVGSAQGKVTKNVGGDPFCR
jgi:hypothetical protein